MEDYITSSEMIRISIWAGLVGNLVFALGWLLWKPESYMKMIGELMGNLHGINGEKSHRETIHFLYHAWAISLAFWVVSGGLVYLSQFYSLRMGLKHIFPFLP